METRNFLLFGLMMVATIGILFNRNGLEFSNPLEKSSSELNNVDAKLWIEWQSKFSKSYSSLEEESFRFQIFRQTLQTIQSHNSKKAKFSMGLNQFSDITQTQFAAIYFTQQKNDQNPSQEKNQTRSKNFETGQVKSNASATANQNVDWVAQGMVPPVLDMGKCQASYAFSAVSVIESLYSIAVSVNLGLSQEQIIQCSQSFDNDGCNGGNLINTYSYINQNKLCTSNQYPFTSYGGSTGDCNTQIPGKYNVPTYSLIPNNCDAVLTALQTAPVNVCIVPGFELQYYSGGIFTNDKCPGDENTYCMSLVGVTIGTSWRLQNSIGTQWGEYGYMNLEYGPSCLVCSNAIQPEF